MNENLEEAKQIVNSEIEAATQKSFDTSILDSAFSRLHFSTAISYDSIKEFAQIYKDQGFISELPGNDLFDAQLKDE